MDGKNIKKFLKTLKTGIESCRLGQNMGKMPKGGMFRVHGIVTNSSESN